MADRSLSTARICATAAISGAAGAAGALATWCYLRQRCGSPWPQQQTHAKSSEESPTCRSAWLTETPGPRPRVILVATGSVATVKAPALAVLLSEMAEVAVVLTSAGSHMAGKVAGRYDAEAAAAFQQLQDQGCVQVLRDVDEWEGYQDVSLDTVVHIELRKWADLVVIAPCSSNTLAKLSLGLCDNLATCLLRAWDPDKPVVVAPAMNTVMWEHPTNSQHLTTLECWGYHIVRPASKRLACGDVGCGALAPLEEVMTAVRLAMQGFEGRRGRDAPGAWQRRGFPEWQSAM